MRVARLWPPVALLAVGGGGCSGPPPPLVTWAEIVAQPAPPPGKRIVYAPDSGLFGDLRLPDGEGPFPVVVVIHGGCWQNAYDLDHVAPLAAALTQEGFATWSIEYRRLGDPGARGLAPLADAGHAVDQLYFVARSQPIDLERVVLLGHSAGGHLALWLASRTNHPGLRELWPMAGARVRGVVALAAIADLAGYGAGQGSCNASVYELMGGTPERYPDLYAKADPMRLLPPIAPVRLVYGTADPIVPPSQAQAYARAATAAGGDVKLVPVKNAGHFDLIAPFAPAWRIVLEQVREVAALPPAER